MTQRQNIYYIKELESIRDNEKSKDEDKTKGGNLDYFFLLLGSCKNKIIFSGHVTLTARLAFDIDDPFKND